MDLSGKSVRWTIPMHPRMEIRIRFSNEAMLYLRLNISQQTNIHTHTLEKEKTKDACVWSPVSVCKVKRRNRHHLYHISSLPLPLPLSTLSNLSLSLSTISRVFFFLCFSLSISFYARIDRTQTSQPWEKKSRSLSSFFAKRFLRKISLSDSAQILFDQALSSSTRS